jgi:RNA 3'-terminal phosphate cyclase (ATP)
LLLPLALAGAGAFKTLPLSSHALTNIETLHRFLDFKIAVESTGGGACVVRVG